MLTVLANYIMITQISKRDVSETTESPSVEDIDTDRQYLPSTVYTRTEDI